MVHIDRAPVRPGWSRGWVQVAVFIYYAAGATSILLNGAMDFPLARFVEAVATDASFSLEMAAVVSSLLLALGQFLCAWDSWVIISAGCFGGVVWWWTSSLYELTVGPSTPERNNNPTLISYRQRRLGWLCWFVKVYYLATACGCFGFAWYDGLGKFGVVEIGKSEANYDLEPTLVTDVNELAAERPVWRAEEGLVIYSEPATIQQYGNLLVTSTQTPQGVGIKVLLVEVGVGILAGLLAFGWLQRFASTLKKVAMHPLVLRSTAEISAGAALVVSHAAAARFGADHSADGGYLAGGYLAGGYLALAVTVGAWTVVHAFVITPLTSCGSPLATHRPDQPLNVVPTLTILVVAVLTWVPWMMVVVWTVAAASRAWVVVSEVREVVVLLDQARRTVLGRGDAVIRSSSRERRLDLITDHFSQVFDELTSQLKARLAGGWAEDWHPAREDVSSTTLCRRYSRELTSWTVWWSSRVVYLAPNLCGCVVNSSRWLLGMGLALMYVFSPSLALTVLVSSTLAPSWGTIHLGCVVIGKPLVHALGSGWRAVLSLVDVAEAVCPMQSWHCLPNAEMKAKGKKKMRRYCWRAPSRPLADRSNLGVAATEGVSALLTAGKRLQEQRTTDAKWLQLQARTHEDRAARVFEARVKRETEGIVTDVWVMRRDFSRGMSCKRALCVSRDQTEVFVVPVASLLKGEAPAACCCGADRATVPVEPTVTPIVVSADEQYRRSVNELAALEGSSLYATMTLGLMDAGDVDRLAKQWLSPPLTAADDDELKRRFAVVTEMVKLRGMYGARDVKKWVTLAGDRLDAEHVPKMRASSTDPDSLAERAGLVGRLLMACPVWSTVFATESPVLPELQSDAIVLGKAADKSIRIPLSETASEEAAGLGYVEADSADFVVPTDWATTWDDDKVSHAAREVRVHLVNLQTEMLRRLWRASEISASLPDDLSKWLEAWGDSGTSAGPSGASTGGSGVGSDSGALGGGGGGASALGGGSGGTSALGGGGGGSTTVVGGGVGATAGGSGGGSATSTESVALDFLTALKNYTLAATTAPGTAGGTPARRTVTEELEAARQEHRRLFSEFATAAGPQMVSSNIGLHGNMIGAHLPGVYAKEESELSDLVGMRSSITTGKPYSSLSSAENYTALLEEASKSQSTVRDTETYPYCAPCTMEKVLAERKLSGKDAQAPVSEEEWNHNLQHASSFDAVFCYRSDHSLLNTKGNGRVYCVPPPRVATPCGVCGVIQYHTGRPHTNCTSCGVPYFTVHTTDYRVDRILVEKFSSFSAREQAAGTGAMMGGGGGAYTCLAKCLRPAVAQERLCDALLAPTPELRRFRWHALTVYCLTRCIFNLHPEFKRDFRLEAGGRVLHSSSFQSIPPERDGLFLTIKWFQTNDGRHKPMVVERSTKNKLAIGGEGPTTAELRAKAAKEAGDSATVEEWRWRKEGANADYARGVREMLDATQNCIDACVGVYGQGYRRDFECAFRTLETMLMSESFGCDLGRAEFQCNLLFADWSRRMRGHFNGSAVGKSYLYKVEVDAGAAVPRPIMSYGLEACLEMEYHTHKRIYAAHTAALYSRGGELEEASGLDLVAKVSGDDRQGAEAMKSKPPSPGPVLSTTTLGFRAVKPKLLGKHRSKVEGGEVCPAYLTARGCPLANCCLVHKFPAMVSLVEYANALPQGGLVGSAPLSWNEMRSVVGGLRGTEPDAEVVRRFFEAVHSYMHPGKSILDTTPIAKRLTTIVSQPLLTRIPMPVAARGGLEIVRMDSVALGHGKCLLVGTSVDVGSRIGAVGSQCVLRSLAAQSEPPLQPSAAIPSHKGSCEECGSHVVQLREDVLRQLSELDPSRLKVDSEVAASYVNCVENATRGLPENFLDLVAPSSLAHLNVLVVSVTDDTVVYRYYPAGGTHNGVPVPAGLVGNPKQYNERANQSETIAVLCRPIGTRGETRHCTVLKVNKLRHDSLIRMLDRFDKCEERVYVAVLQRGGLGPLNPRLVRGIATRQAIEAAQAHFRCLIGVGGFPAPELSGNAGGAEVVEHVLCWFRKEFADSLTKLRARLGELEGRSEPPDPSEYKVALSEPQRICGTYFTRLVALARDGRAGKLEVAGKPVSPERLALVSLRNACVHEFYDGRDGENAFWEESAERVMGATLPGHAEALDAQLREGERSHFLGNPEGVWNENHPSAAEVDPQRALIRDMAKQAVQRRGLLFDTASPEMVELLLAAGVRRSPLATTGKRCEDGRPAMEAHWDIPKYRTITDATNRRDREAPNAGIFMYSHAVQQTTDLEQLVLAILRIETPGGLLEASKEDISDAFRLIVTAEEDFGLIAYGVMDSLYVPTTLAFGMRHSPSGFEARSRAVLDVYNRTRDCDEARRYDACERFVDDFVQIVNCSSSITPTDELRDKLRAAIRDVCGPTGLNAEKSSGKGRTELPIFGVYFDFVKRRLYPNAYKVHDFVEEARAFVDGKEPYLTLQQASRLQGLGNFLFQTCPRLMSVFQSRLSSMLSKEEEARYKKNGIPPSPAFKHEDDCAGWEALRRSLRVVCMLIKWRGSRLLVKPFEAGLKMPQRLLFPGREDANNFHEVWSDSCRKGSCGVDSSTGKGVHFEFTAEQNKFFDLAQRKWAEEIGGSARCINFRELHAATVTSVLTAPDHVGGIVRYAIDNQAAEAWLAGSGTELNHVEMLLEVNECVNFLLGIDSCSRYVKTAENKWMDAGSRFDTEEFDREVQKWEQEHPGKRVEWMQVPDFLLEMGGVEANYGSSSRTWEIMGELMGYWRENGIGPFNTEELDELQTMFRESASGSPLPGMPAPVEVVHPSGPSEVRVQLSDLNHSRNSLLRKLLSGSTKRALEGDIGGADVFARVNAIMQCQWERARRLLLVPVKNDHPTTFRLPEAVPRGSPGDIRLCESFCGQGAMGKALLASGGGELVVYAESDPWCRAHLARVFPGAKALHDHRQVSARVLKHYRINVFACGPPCPNHSVANPRRQGGSEGTGRYYAECATAAIEARVPHILVECTPGVGERNGCDSSPLDQLRAKLEPLYHVQIMKVDTPRVRSPYSGYVAPVHHSRLYVVATLKAFRALPMKFRVESESVLAADASPIFGKISLEGECEAMPTDDVRQLARENRRGGGGSLRNTIQYVGRVAGTRGNKSPSQGMFRDLVFDPLRGLMPTYTGAGGSGWVSVLQDGLTVVRKPTLREAAAAYGLRYLDEELARPCEGLQSAIGNAIPGPVAEAFMAQVLLDRGRDETREAFLEAWSGALGSSVSNGAPLRDLAVGPKEPASPCAGSIQGPPRRVPKKLPLARCSGGPTIVRSNPKLSKGISKLCGTGGSVDHAVLGRVRLHVSAVMRGGINPDSQSRYNSSLKCYYEYSDLVGKAPLHRRLFGAGGEGGMDTHLLFQHHVVEYLAFCNVVNGNCAGTLRSKLSHISWAHTSAGLDDPLKKHHATYVESWMRALERRQPKCAAGKRPATPSLLLMVKMAICRFAQINPVYYLAISAAVDTAWCFMLRSREYLAVPEKGSSPMRWGQIVFRDLRGEVLQGKGVQNAERVTIRLPSTKNDLGNPTRSVRRTNEPICCVQALVNLYLSHHRRAEGDRLLAPDAPVFVGGLDGNPLSRDDVNHVIELSAKELYGTEQAKLFRSHSLRHGGASAYAAAGVPLHVIKEFGRWKSDAYMVYVTLSVDVLDAHIRKAQAQALVLEERK